MMDTRNLFSRYASADFNEMAKLGSGEQKDLARVLRNINAYPWMGKGQEVASGIGLIALFRGRAAFRGQDLLQDFFINMGVSNDQPTALFGRSRHEPELALYMPSWDPEDIDSLKGAVVAAQGWEAASSSERIIRTLATEEVLQAPHLPGALSKLEMLNRRSLLVAREALIAAKVERAEFMSNESPLTFDANSL